MGAEEWGGQWSLTLQNRNSFLLSKPTNLKKITLSISKLMKTSARFIGLRAVWPLAIALLTAVCGNAATPDDAPARSVNNLKLRISPNGRYFVDHNSKPFFYLGDTCWLLFQRPNRDEVDEYLKDRAAKGFTVIQAYVLRGLGQKHPDGNSSLLDATPLLDRDPARPNEEFFKNVDYVVNRANEFGLVMGLVTAKSWHVADHPEKVFDEKNAYVFGKFLGERYKNNAVISGHHFGSDSYAFVSKDYALTPAKPTVDMEPAYENHPTGDNKPRIDAHKVRSQAYSAMLAGAAGHGYGSLDLFWFYKDADGPFPKNGFQQWRRAIAYEGSQQVGLMRRLFEQRPWYKMVPDQSVIASDQGEGTKRLVAARAEDVSFLIAYTPVGQSVSIKMNKLHGSKVKAQWYDPRGGTWKAIGQYPNKGTQEFVPPSHGEQDDWVLVLDTEP